MSRLGELRRRSRSHERRRRPIARSRHGVTTTGTAEVDFVKLSPTGNMTLLVRSAHPVAEYRLIAGQLLSAGHVHAEQVGFIRRPLSAGAQVRLHMAGDEFCGNACMALAALTAAEQSLDVGERVEIVLEASGARENVICLVERRASGYHCELAMPLPDRVAAFPFPGVEAGRSALVRYAEAAHLVVESAPHDPDTRVRAEAMAEQLATSEDVPVVGVMLYDPEHHDLAPLINVPTLDSMVWEQSCGSGTASVGAHLAAKFRGAVRTSVHQPGGTMRVHADHDAEGLSSVRIGGEVRIVAEGTAYVHV